MLRLFACLCLITLALAQEACHEGYTCSGGDLSYCKYPTGVCGADGALGMCASKPFVCPTIARPVCGCDGKTYKNYCFASLANQSIAYPGSCDVRKCKSSADCVDSSKAISFCSKPKGQCDAEGVCMGVPSATECTPEMNPVCGCDGLTYDNPCDAFANRISIDNMGVCTNNSDSCVSDADCPQNNTYCQFPVGQCTPPGKCVKVPFACPHIIAPVCDCDGMNWKNGCYAERSKKNIADLQQCQGTQKLLTSNEK